MAEKTSGLPSVWSNEMSPA